MKCAVCGTVRSWPNGKAAASQTCPGTLADFAAADARTGRSVLLAHDEPGIDRQRVFGVRRECRYRGVPLLVTNGDRRRVA